MGRKNMEVKTSEPALSSSGKKVKKTKSKKRAAPSDLDSQTGENTFTQEAKDVEDDPNELTLGERLAATLTIDKTEDASNVSSKPPSAASIHVLLKQAVHADDRVLLLECLHTQDEKVISNSISLLGPSDVFKLLDSLISIVESRGAVLVCVIPWLKCLLLQHATRIISQESSIRSLNSLYQIIESRVSTYQSAIKLSSIIDYKFVGIHDDVDDDVMIQPTIYEDVDDESNDDEVADDSASEIEHDSDEPPLLNGFSDFEDDDLMMSE
ncbi:hypothetical protein ACHQM5_014242 [Ranunculus cassubicifolius]